MNSPETQSDSSSQETYFDPEVMDTSEQEFSASLETSGEAPGFVVDSPETSAATPEVTDFAENVERRAPRPSTTDLAIQGDTDREISKNEEQYTSSSQTDAESPSDWRDQVSAKVKHYKTLKPRKERYPSLQLQFDSVVPWKSDKSPLTAERAEFLASAPTDFPPPTFEPEQRISYPASTEATARAGGGGEGREAAT